MIWNYIFVLCNWYFWSLFVWTTNGALSKFEAKIVSEHINSSNAINGKPQPYTKLFIVARALMKTKWINQNSGNKTQQKKWCCFNLPLTRQRKHIWSHINEHPYLPMYCDWKEMTQICIQMENRNNGHKPSRKFPVAFCFLRVLLWFIAHLPEHINWWSNGSELNTFSTESNWCNSIQMYWNEYMW